MPNFQKLSMSSGIYINERERELLMRIYRFGVNLNVNNVTKLPSMPHNVT